MGSVVEKAEFTKNKRRLKNRMSALKSRERKREKLNELEDTIAKLTEEVHRLQAENRHLREHTYSTDSNIHTDNPSKRTRIEESHIAESGKMSQMSNLAELVFDQSKATSAESLSCAHNNGGSALGDAMDEFAFDVIDDLDNFLMFDSADAKIAPSVGTFFL